MQRIFVDADSCPRQAREMVLRFSERFGIKAIFVANRPIPGTTTDFSRMELCPPGEGAADNYIVEHARQTDLVLTRDLPLAERLVEKGIRVLDDRGRVFSRENIRELRSLRDFVVSLAESGQGIERSSSYGRKELSSFANSLDRELCRLRQLQDKAAESV